MGKWFNDNLMRAKVWPRREWFWLPYDSATNTDPNCTPKTARQVVA